MKITLNRIDTNFNPMGNECWVHARAGAFPDRRVVMTAQRLRLTGSDIFSGLSCFCSADGGKTWSTPLLQPGLARRPWGDGMEIAMCDATPFFHRRSGRMLLTGHTVIYDRDEIMEPPRPRATAWSVYDETAGAWSEFKLLEMPGSESAFFSCGSGCGQCVELDNGSILLPVYYMTKEESLRPWENCFKAAVVRCSFDGRELKYLEIGNSLSVSEPRGLYEPSLFRFGGRFFLTLRNDVRGYVAASDDGLIFDAPEPWRFDDGEELGSYCTQQHWLSVGDSLCLVYTRRGAGNDHVFRHRAPLFVARVDPERLCVVRKSERIAVPQRGARLGNFGCLQVSPAEAWVVAAEWMQNGPGPAGVELCRKHGSDNSIFIAKITGD